MAQYIDKSALVAWIESQKDSLERNSGCSGIFGESQMAVYDKILSFIDTLEEPTNEDLEEAAVEAFKQIVDTDKNNFLEIFKAGAEWKRGRMLDEDYAWAIYNFINKWKSGEFGEVSLQKALDDFGKDVQL